MQASLSTLDLTIVVVYFFSIIAIGLLLSKKNSEAEDYFLAGRSMTWPFVGFSLFASNISSIQLIGLSGDAYATGISVFNYEWMAAIILVLFCVFLLPQIVRSQVYTMPEYLEGRYDYRVRIYFAALTIFLNIVVDTSACLYAGGLLVRMAFPDMQLWMIIAFLAIAAGSFTIFGGLVAVMKTDVIQAILLIVASIVLSYFAFEKAGGFFYVLETVPSEKMSLIRPLDDQGVPWLGLLTGVPLLGFYYWCTNQSIVQRILSAKDVTHGRKGALFAGALKLPILFIMVLPGSAAILLYPDLPKSDMVYPTLLFDILPTGVIGLVIAGFLAALLGQVASTLNSASTMMTMDFVYRVNPNLSSKKLALIGKINTFIFMLAAVCWAPFIERFDSLFKYLQAVFAYGVPPIIAVFILGTFWKRANAQGALATLCIGTISGIVFAVMNLWLKIIDIHFLYIVPILTIISIVTHILVSLIYAAPSLEKVNKYIWTVDIFKQDGKELKGVAWYNNYRILSIILCFATFVVVISFI